MDLFLQQLMNGITSGAIYGSLALALVLIYRATHIINFAQGEMAMFCVFIAWQSVRLGMPVWAAFLLTLAIAFLGGMAVERLLIRPMRGGSELSIVLVTVGLLFIFNQGAGFLWGFMVKKFPSLFADGRVQLGAISLTDQMIGTFAVLLVVVVAMYLLFQKTRIGLAMRVAAADPESSRLVGVAPSRMRMLGWGLASLIGTVSGVLAAPVYFLSPSLMSSVMIYAFAAATLGGFDSIGGAIVGGLVIGVSENMAGTYINALGSDLKVVVPLGFIVLVLMFRPAGLFGRKEVVRV
ncbi:Branched-chain amino acid transport system permease protein OS=Castellaniella defragrans OX=75697 GN=HNR28_003410 PE=3 SV=1 [Castellaniella defragrans]